MNKYIAGLYGLQDVREDKSIFRTFKSKKEKDNWLLEKGIITLEQFRIKQGGRLSDRELKHLENNQIPY